MMNIGPAVAWWRRQTRPRQLGMMGIAAYGGLLAATRLARQVVARRGVLRPYPPPGQMRDVYRGPGRMQPTGGLVGTLDRRKVGHTSYGQARQQRNRELWRI